ncbi:MAG: demethylmenaquinone methyltransferase [Streptosporangiales bacterium]|nr:demethylmenaquinone methyltransferase [Streptosporangiales bacterium]
MRETWSHDDFVSRTTGGGSVRAGLDKRPAEVAAMFDQVAARYDATNLVMSLGQDRLLWRPAVVRAIDPRPGQRILDLAAGTGPSTVPLAELGAEVVACDFSLGMLRVGKRRHPELPFVAADALALPFADATFDAVTISFGLRNIVDVHTALAELLRVTVPGGRIVVCEVSTPTWRPFRLAYDVFLGQVLPAAGRVVSSDPEAYRYLVDSIREWPDQPALARTLQDAGWSRVAWRNLSGGAVALHRGYRPG